MTINEIREQKLLIFECISGSRAYGLATEESDTDVKGVFVLPKDAYFGLDYIPQVNNETNDVCYYEIGRFIELLAKNNPNLLEMLFVSEEFVLRKNPIFDSIDASVFISKLCRTTFAGYAADQIKRARGLKKKMLNPMDRAKKRITEFCYVIDGSKSIPLEEWLGKKGLDQRSCGLANIKHTKDTYAVFQDPDSKFGFQGIIRDDESMDVCLSSVREGVEPVAIMFYNKDAYSQYCREYQEYWEWINHRNEARYRSTMAHGKKYDAKNMMHTFRLIEIAEEIALTGRFSTARPNREELLKIKSGEYSYDELMERAKKKLESIESFFERSNLQERPDMEAVNRLLVSMRKRFYESGCI